MDELGYSAWLATFLSDGGGIAGTIHLRDEDQLRLVASINIPPKVVELTRTVPSGKGMAGLALERHAPVQTCNLKTDKSGDVKPGAKAVDAQAAVALPVDDSAGEVRAIVGIAFHDERELSPQELASLIAVARSLP